MIKALTSILISMTILAMGASAQEYKDGWIIYSDVDEFDGTSAYYAAKEGRGDFSADERMLVIRCQNNETDLYVIMDEYMIMGDYRAVTETRVDNVEIDNYFWTPSVDSTTVFLRNPVSKIKDLFSKKKFGLRIFEEDYEQNTAIFDLKGLEGAVTAVRQNCDW